MDKKQIKLVVALPFLGLAAMSVTRCARADVPEGAAAVAAILAAKTAYVVAYATPIGKSLDSTRYAVANALCYAPDNEMVILETAIKIQESVDVKLNTAIGIAVVATCNKAMNGSFE